MCRESGLENEGRKMSGNGRAKLTLGNEGVKIGEEVGPLENTVELEFGLIGGLAGHGN